MSELLIQATPALLEGWTGPVCRPIRPGVTLQLVCVDGVAYEGGTETSLDAYLDLSRAECRDRVARMLRLRCPNMTQPEDGCSWKDSLADDIPEGRVEIPDWDEWTPYPWEANGMPLNDTRLPDGSRLVDALALAAVWREVSGA